MFATGDDGCPVATFSVSMASSSRNKDNQSSFLSCVLNPSLEAEGSEQDGRHDEVRHKRNDPGRFLEDLFQPQSQETAGLERGSGNGPQKREVTG